MRNYFARAVVSSQCVRDEAFASPHQSSSINREDNTVPLAIEKALPQIEALVEQIVPRMQKGGRQGIVDASECLPTYGVPHDWVIGLILAKQGQKNTELTYWLNAG